MLEAVVGKLLPELEYSPEKFLKMLWLPKFQKALAISARHTAKTGFETGFNIDILPDGGPWIEDVRAGSTDRMEGSTVLEEIDGPRDYNLPCTEYFHFHFHPGAEEMAIPSPFDLKAFKDKSDLPEHVGVGRVDRDGKVGIIVMIRPKYRLIKHDIKFYDEEVDKVTDYEGLQNLLRTIGISSFLVKFKTTASSI